MISELTRDSNVGGMPLSAISPLSNVNDIKIGGWQFGVGVVQLQDLWLSDRRVSGDGE